MTPSKSIKRWEPVFILVIQWIFVLVQGAPYYRREYSGYLFTIPGFDDTQRRSQSDAQNWCRQNGTSLLEISNASVQNAVMQFINDIFNIHLTGNNIITSGKESFTSSCYWVTGNVFQQGYQIVGQGGGSQYSYAYLDTNPFGYSAVVDLPTTQRYYICEGTESDCTNGYQTSGRCYKSFSDRLSWYDSRNRCLERGGDLASFDWMTTNQNLNVLNGSWITSSSSYWIGLRRISWNWQSSNTDVKYSQWSGGHPFYDQNLQCLCLLPNTPVKDWKWSECSCTETFQFVCISAVSPFSSSTSSSSSSSSSATTIQSLSSGSTQTKASSSTSMNSPNHFSTSSTPSPSDNSTGPTPPAVNTLAIGLGVGLGGGFLIVIIIIAVVLVLKFNIHRRFSRRKPLPDVTLTGVEATHYAVVQSKNQPVDEDSTFAYNTVPSSNFSAEYAPIVVIQGGNTDTIGPPKLPKSTDSSAMYAEINK